MTDSEYLDKILAARIVYREAAIRSIEDGDERVFILATTKYIGAVDDLLALSGRSVQQ